MANDNSRQVPSTSQQWVESLSEIRQQLHDQNHYYLQDLKTLHHSIHTLTQAVNSLQTHLTSQPHTNHPNHVNFPKFDGNDPQAWIFRSQEFFEYHNVPPEQRLSHVSFMVHGEASEWFRWMESNGLLRSWEDFLVQVKFRFDPIYFENFTVQFSKSHHVPTMTTYQTEHEKRPPVTPNEGQHHEVDEYLEHSIEYSNTKPDNCLDVEHTLDEHVTLSRDHPSRDVMEVLQENAGQESGSSQSHDHTQQSFESFFLPIDHQPRWHEFPRQMWLYFIPLYTLRSRCFLKGWRVIRIKGRK